MLFCAHCAQPSSVIRPRPLTPSSSHLEIKTNSKCAWFEGGKEVVRGVGWRQQHTDRGDGAFFCAVLGVCSNTQKESHLLMYETSHVQKKGRDVEAGWPFYFFCAEADAEAVRARFFASASLPLAPRSSLELSLLSPSLSTSLLQITSSQLPRFRLLSQHR